MNRRGFLGLIVGAVVAPLVTRGQPSTGNIFASIRGELTATTSFPNGVVRRCLYRTNADGSYRLIGVIPDGATGYSTSNGGRWLFPER